MVCTGTGKIPPIATWHLIFSLVKLFSGDTPIELYTEKHAYTPVQFDI